MRRGERTDVFRLRQSSLGDAVRRPILHGRLFYRKPPARQDNACWLCADAVWETGHDVPAFGEFIECGRKALIGWNGKREAARAAFDAVPILKSCDAVQVTWLDPQTSMDVPGSLPGAELATALARHGITVTAEGLPTSGIGAGEALLSHVSDLGANLLVMGAYGHSRTREYIFGGATRTIFDSMTVPVLMSH